MTIYSEVALLEEDVSSLLYSELQFANVPGKGDYVEIDNTRFVVCFVTHTPSPVGTGSKVRVTVRRG